jgi:hypothetical protein
MCLKPRMSINIAFIVGGVVLSVMGLGSCALVGIFNGPIIGVFVMLGLVWVVVGILKIGRRGQMAIVIDETGIQLPAFALFQRNARSVFIRREDIGAVSKNESLKGRLIEIRATSGHKVLVQARNYCELEEFLSHCKRFGFPVEELG